MAEAFRTYLESIFGPKVKPWFSPVDIAKGTFWSAELAAALDRSQFGIICVTRSNKKAEWLLFESGAIAKTVGRSRVCPILLDLKANELAGPLAQFQATLCTKRDIRLLAIEVNNHLRSPLPIKKFDAIIHQKWPWLTSRLKQIQRRTDQVENAGSILEKIILLAQSVNSVEDLTLRPVKKTIRNRKKK
jgi:hypothetical protein